MTTYSIMRNSITMQTLFMRHTPDIKDQLITFYIYLWMHLEGKWWDRYYDIYGKTSKYSDTCKIGVIFLKFETA